MSLYLVKMPAAQLKALEARRKFQDDICSRAVRDTPIDLARPRGVRGSPSPLRLIRVVPETRSPRSDTPKRCISIKNIQELVAHTYGCSRGDLLSSLGTRNVTKPRQIAIYLCEILTSRSRAEIGLHFGDLDPTTIRYAIRKIAWLIGERTVPPPYNFNKQISVDPVLREEVEELKRLLRE